MDAYHKCNHTDTCKKLIVFSMAGLDLRQSEPHTDTVQLETLRQIQNRLIGKEGKPYLRVHIL